MDVGDAGPLVGDAVEGGIGAFEDAGGEGGVGFDGVFQVESAGIGVVDDFDDAVEDAADGGNLGEFDFLEQTGDAGVHAIDVER